MSLESSIKQYHVSDQTAKLVRATQLLLIAGVVGGGKNTVINKIKEDNDRYHEIVSHTTRKPRVNHGVQEKGGVDYYFVTLEQAEKLVDEQAFVEVKYVHGDVYGTSAGELQVALDNDKTAITDVDVQGVMEYLDIKPDMHAIFLLPPSVDTWLKRLERRYGDLETHKDEVTKRFRTAQREIKHIQQDKRFILVINDDLETTVERIEGILDGTVTESSEYAEVVSEHLLDYIESKI